MKQTFSRILVNEVVEPLVPNTIIIPDDVKIEGVPMITPSGALTRSQRKNLEEYTHLKTDAANMDATTARLEKEHEEVREIEISSPLKEVRTQKNCDRNCD